MLDMRSVRLELLAADAAHSRLLPWYEASHFDEVYSEQAEIETVTTIRALRAASEKLINGLHLELTGEPGDMLYFPATREALAGKKYQWLDAFPEVREQIYLALRPGGAIVRLRQRYSDAAHHGVIRHETAVAPGVGFEVQDGVVVAEVRISKGYAMMVSSENLPQFWRGFSGMMLRPDGTSIPIIGDFVFDDDGTSVMAFLVDAYNAMVRLYQRIGDLRGWDVDGVSPFTMGGRPSGSSSMRPIQHWPEDQDSPVVTYIRVESP